MKNLLFHRWLLPPLLLMSLFIFLLLMITKDNNAQPLQTVPYVDLKKYAGKWYEIATYPQFFQKGCHCTTAEYTWTEHGYVIVENRCNKERVLGPVSYIKGKAFVEAGSGNAKLKVQFFWPFRGKYWIIELAEDYSYAVVSHPNKKYLWILSRTSTMEESLYQKILSSLQSKGFDLSKLQKTVHR